MATNLGHPLEQEMKAKVAENRSRLVEAEAQVPLAIAEAFRKGNINESHK